MTTGAVPGDWFFERFAGDQQEADALFAGLDYDFVAAVEEDKAAVFGFGGRGGVERRSRKSRRSPPRFRRRQGYDE